MQATEPRHFVTQAEVDALITAMMTSRQLGGPLTPCPTCGRWREQGRCVPCETQNGPVYGGEAAQLRAERDAAIRDRNDAFELFQHSDQYWPGRVEEIEAEWREKVRCLERERDLWQARADHFERRFLEAR